MISKEQLQDLASKTGLPLYQQEKDYFLKLFLYFYYKRFKDAVFKGGTCLKYLLGVPRFSEDLDFTILKPKKFKEQVEFILKDFQKLAITCFFLKEEVFEDSYTCELGFHGPLYRGSPQTQNKFRIDAGYRTGILRKPQWELIKSEYPETEENFLALVMDREEIMAEKVMALSHRTKGRDIFDLWFLSHARIALDTQLLREKMKKEKLRNLTFNLPSKQEYERDMSRLTSRVISYEQVKKEVEKLLEKVK